MSDSNCATGVRHVSVSLPASHPARVGQVSGRCPTGGPPTIRRPTAARVGQAFGRCYAYSASVRQTCLASGRQMSGNRLDSIFRSSKCPKTSVRHVSVRLPACHPERVERVSGKVSDRWSNKCSASDSSTRRTGFRQVFDKRLTSTRQDSDESEVVSASMIVCCLSARMIVSCVWFDCLWLVGKNDCLLLVGKNDCFLCVVWSMF